MPHVRRIHAPRSARPTDALPWEARVALDLWAHHLRFRPLADGDAHYVARRTEDAPVHTASSFPERRSDAA